MNEADGAEPDDNRDYAREFADAIMDSFGSLHPAVTMTWNEWRDLREMIERQWIGNGASAEDLVDCLLYIKRRRNG